MKIDNHSLASWLLSIAVVLGLLVYGRMLLVPLAFALMLWAILNALKNLLRRARIPAVAASLLAFALIGVALYFIVVVTVNEAAAIADKVPVYNSQLDALWLKMPYRKRLPMLDLPTLMQQLNLPGTVTRLAASVGGVVMQLALVIIYVAFLLAEQGHLPRKIVRLQSNPQKRGEATDVVRAVAAQIQSYIGVCTLLSALMGVFSYLTLAWLKVDFSGFWALLLFFGTYIPTVGAIFVLLPALAALAQFGAVGPALAIVLVLGFAHFFLTNVLMTVMLGRSLDLSPFVIMLSLTFWGLVWGVAGLFLAVPMTGAIAIACRHLDGFGWVAELIAGPPPRNWRFGKMRSHT